MNITSISSDPIKYTKNEIKTNLLVPTMKASKGGFLGEGCFGSVFIHGKDQNLVVKKSYHDLSKEYEVARYLDHPCLAGVKQLFIKLYPNIGNQMQFKLVMERIIGNNLDDYFLFSDKKLSNQDVKVLCEDAKDTIQYLFKQKVYWADLKVDNLFITTNGHLKLCDYGYWKKEENPSIRTMQLFLGAMKLLEVIIKSSCMGIGNSRGMIYDTLLPCEFLDQIQISSKREDESARGRSVYEQHIFLRETTIEKLVKKNEDEQLKCLEDYVDSVKAKFLELTGTL